MSAQTLWTAMRTCTSEIVQTNSFRRITGCVPYSENWWHSELAWRFDHCDQGAGYRLVGFDIQALQFNSFTFLQPDLLLDRTSNGIVEEIVWLQLQQLNLQRRTFPASECVAPNLRSALNDCCKHHREDLVNTLNIDVIRTAEQKFKNSRHRQQQTLLNVYRDRPLELFRGANHLAATFMLAAVPSQWSSDFKTSLDRSVRRFVDGSIAVFAKTELLCEWETESGRIGAHLSCLISELSCRELSAGVNQSSQLVRP
jgi:hypothetical protein